MIVDGRRVIEYLAMAMMARAFYWWLGSSLLGWLTWPWVAYLLGQLPGRGYAYARALGLLVPTYLYLLFGVLGLLPNKDWALWSVAGGVALWGAVGWWHRRRELAAFARQRWRHLLIVEALFLLLFLHIHLERNNLIRMLGSNEKRLVSVLIFFSYFFLRVTFSTSVCNLFICVVTFM